MKNLSPTFLAQISAGRVKPVLFLEIAFENETVYLWSGSGTITPAGPAYSGSATFPYGQAFTGMGWLGRIDAIPQTSEVIAQNITLMLSGIPVELVTDAITAVRQNSIATVWLGFFDATNTVIPDPVQMFQGHLDVPTLTEGAQTCTLSITCENPLVDLNRAPNHRFTLEDQVIFYPGDAGFAQVGLMQGRYLGWPQFELLP